VTTVPGLLAARAAADPEHVALIVPDAGALSLGDWLGRSTAVARRLVERGVRPGDRVGLYFGGAGWLDYAVGYCGVQLAGGVAVPLSTGLPVPELRFRLAHSGACGLLHGVAEPPAGLPGWAAPLGPLAAAVPPAGAERAAPPAAAERAGSGRSAGSGEPVDIEIRPEDPAQILYTSGTTGAAKGVLASHANLTYGLPPRRPRYGHSRHFLHAFPIGSNAGQMMLIDALVAAPAAVAAPSFDAARFCALIERYRVGTVFLVPSMAIELLRSGATDRYDLGSVQLISSSAAALPGAVAADLVRAFPAATIVNAYTSTEAVPAVTTMVVDPGRPGSVGRPAADGAIMIADRYGQALPVGEVGDVWLRHRGAARSYYRDPAASDAVFRAGWVRMGDVGRLDADGYLYLLDRDSDLISSGGHRVSTLHVEAVLHEHPAVAEAAVFGVPHPVMGAMVAAAVTVRSPVGVAELRGFLRDRLSRAELPTRLVIVDALPRNEAGKVLKRELRELSERPAGQAPELLADPAVEARLGALWRRVLRVRSAGAGDDFFALGGDSLTATQLATVAGEAFGVAVPAALAFDHPTLSAQAAWLATARPAAAPPVGAGPGDQVPLTALQEYFLRWMGETDPPRVVSNLPVAVRITDDLDLPALDAAVRAVAGRHDALRTVFRDGRAVLLADCPPEITHCSAATEAAAARLAAAAVERPFDLAAGPLARVVTIRLGERDHVLALAVHHLVTDGWSMGVLLRDLALAYSALRDGRQPAARQPGPTAAEVAGWARAQWPASRAYWRETLAGAPAALPAAPRLATPDRYTAASLPVELPVDIADRFREVGRRHGATAYQAVLAAWARVLGEWAGAPELVVMSPVPGRGRPELAGVVGCLVQSLLLRLDLRGAPSYPRLLRRVRATVLAATDRQHYPYEEFSRKVPHPAWFRYERWPGEACFPGLASGPFALPRELMFDWPMPPGEVDRSVPELALTEQPDGSLAGWLVYNRRAFDRPTVAALGDALRSYAEAVLDLAGVSGR
jgi:acyl-CoA synthetase (AMP-forming)/AMP-acid ligase II